MIKKKLIRRLLGIVIVIILCGTLNMGIGSEQKSTEVLGITQEDKNNGISVTISKYTRDTDFAIWSDKLSDIDCNVELCTMEYINNPTDYEFTSVSDIMTKMEKCRMALEVNNKHITILKPHIGTIAEGDGFHRYTYMPSNIAEFFSNWKETLLWYASYADNNGIPMLCITCEQNLLTSNTYTSYWKDITSDIKTKYPNLKLVIAYQPVELQRDIKSKKLGQETLCDYVDSVGLNTYINIDRKDNFKYFQTENVMYSEFKKIFNKPLFIAETGATKYSNTSNTNYIAPIYLKSSIVDYTDQRVYLDVTLNYMLNNENISGVYLWHITSPFAILDDKESKDVIKKWFGSN